MGAKCPSEEIAACTAAIAELAAVESDVSSTSLMPTKLNDSSNQDELKATLLLNLPPLQKRTSAVRVSEFQKTFGSMKKDFLCLDVINLILLFVLLRKHCITT